VTFLGWWTWTACFFCLLATEIPTGRRSRGRARPGRKIVQRASGSERVRDEESCEPSGQAQRSRGLARSGPPVKIEGPEDKSSSLVHQELLTSAGVAARGSCSIHVQDERRTSCFTATGYASGGSHHLASLRRAGSRSERRLPWRKLQTALGFLGVVRTFSAAIKITTWVAPRLLAVAPIRSQNPCQGLRLILFLRAARREADAAKCGHADKSAFWTPLPAQPPNWATARTTRAAEGIRRGRAIDSRACPHNAGLSARRRPARRGRRRAPGHGQGWSAWTLRAHAVTLSRRITQPPLRRIFQRTKLM
jgi:hypothetical protein